MSTTPTKQQFATWDRKIKALEKIHECDPANWTARVTSPGFAPTYEGPGVLTWTCDVCRPLIVPMVDECWGGVEVTLEGP